ncbi:hypothetical protein P8452_22321 [Trifolium repens]|nr:hypothetical protein P8452_22321 [Trifolium repens]
MLPSCFLLLPSVRVLLFYPFALLWKGCQLLLASSYLLPHGLPRVEQTEQTSHQFASSLHIYHQISIVTHSIIFTFPKFIAIVKLSFLSEPVQVGFVFEFDSRKLQNCSSQHTQNNIHDAQ